MLRKRLGKEVLLFDGAMGSVLQQAGLRIGELPEVYQMTHPKIIRNIHKEYLKAGADIITTNTFGAHPTKLANSGYDVTEIAKAAVDLAIQARDEVNPSAFIALDIGPIGQMLKPLGTLSFDDAYAMFASLIHSVKDVVDLVLIETMSDLYEVKAAVLAAKENSDLPIFVTMTFDQSGRTLTGCDAMTFATAVEGLGIDALGINCSLGPNDLYDSVKTLLQTTSLPIILQPNAGLPVMENGKTHYHLTPEEFRASMESYLDMGVAVIGGCCGTTPAFIAQSKQLLPRNVVPRTIEPSVRITSQNCTLTFLGHPLVCGERCNPTGKKKLQAALKAGDYEAYIVEAIRQDQAGANLLDVNAGLPGIDEASALKTIMERIQEVINLPLQLDSSSADAIETACRYYNGKPLINSVNGKNEVMDRIFPIVKKYGAAIIALTMEDDIPCSAQERLHIAEKIVQKAQAYGIAKENILIDCLTLTASAQQKEVQETLQALSLIRDTLHVPTVLGVSNISFGLPKRSLLNRTFLTLAMHCGLDLAIINPLDQDLMDTIDAYKVVSYQDKDCAEYISKHAQNIVSTTKTSSFTIEEMITFGMKEEIKDKTKELLKEIPPMDIIQDFLIPSLNQVGSDYEKNKIFLPQLIQSAETAKQSFEVIQSCFSLKSQTKATVMMATVEGDVHDIGKNIVKVVLESYGYNVIDLGKDVPVQKVVDSYQKHQPDIIGLSALMTTTVIHMKKTIDALKQIPITCPIWVGGAVLNEEIANEIGADYYCEDAMASVHLCNTLFS